MRKLQLSHLTPWVFISLVAHAQLRGHGQGCHATACWWCPPHAWRESLLALGCTASMRTSTLVVHDVAELHLIKRRNLLSGSAGGTLPALNR